MSSVDGLPLVYLDQNILGYASEGRFSINGDFMAVYSNEHFSEMARGADRGLFEPLRALKARRIISVLVNFVPTGELELLPYEDPEEAFDRYLEAVGEVPVDESIHCELLAGLFGADNPEVLQALPIRLKDQLIALFEIIGDDAVELVARGEEAVESLQGLVDDWVPKSEPLNDQRKRLGMAKGVASAFEGKANPIRAIWEEVRAYVAGVSEPQFFGLQSYDGKDWVPREQFDAVVVLHTILNHLGYRPDKGLIHAERLPNVLSDGRHMAYGSYCSVVLSADRRFRAKATAIYEYLGLSINVPEIEFSNRA